MIINNNDSKFLKDPYTRNIEKKLENLLLKLNNFNQSLDITKNFGSTILSILTDFIRENGRKPDENLNKDFNKAIETANEFNETQRATQFAKNIHREVNSILGIYSDLIEDIANIGLVQLGNNIIKSINLIGEKINETGETMSLINKWGINGKGKVIVKIRNLINELVKILNNTKGYLALTIGLASTRVEGEGNYIDRLISSQKAIQENYEILDSFHIDYGEENDQVDNQHEDNQDNEEDPLNDDQLENNNGELDQFKKIVSELIVKSEFIMNDANTRAVFSMQILTAILENLLPSARFAFNSSNQPIQATISVREALNG